MFTVNKYKVLCFFFIVLTSCTSDSPTPEIPTPEIDTDGDGIFDSKETANGTDKNNPCNPTHITGYSAFNSANTIWAAADCDNDGIANGLEITNGTDSYFNDLDADGDGVLDTVETAKGTDKNNPCDPVHDANYNGYNASNAIWAAADCDNDGIANGVEVAKGTNPYLDDLDTDGDGLLDTIEAAEGTDKNNPCDSVHDANYNGYNASNAIWAAADCDDDGVANGVEVTNETNPYVNDCVFAVAELKPNLSELKVFDGPLSDLKFNKTSHEYSLITPLFTDYSYKLRSISLPKNAKMIYNGEGLLDFPDDAIITKTFYYLNDERDATLGKKIIETRVLIKKNGSWIMGVYVWNDAQNEAVLKTSYNVQEVLVDYKNKQGDSKSVAYRVPNMNACIQCHNNNGNNFPIGPKVRNMNFEFMGKNQIEYFIDKNMLIGAPSVTQISVFPDWDDTSDILENRARAYMDVNCAHCHQPGGFNNNPDELALDLRFETLFINSEIDSKKIDIVERVKSDYSNYLMPYAGTTIKHVEGVSLIEDYINSLD